MHKKNLPTPAHVPASHALKWLVAGWTLFMRAPVVWAIQTLIFITLGFIVTIVPLFGPFLLAVLFPVFGAGMVCGCEILSRGGELEVRHLFEGFRRSQSNLLLLGGGYLMGAGLILLIAVSTAGIASLATYLAGNFGPVGAVLGGLILGGALFYVLWVLLLLALWFSPALVVLGPIAPLDAMLLSLRACARNWAALSILAVAIYIITPLAMLPAGLGMLVLTPVIVGAAYASWRDVFGHDFARLIDPHAEHAS